MSEQAQTRFSQAQVLIAALFTVVMTGQMPDLSPYEAIDPLRLRFASVCSRSKWREWLIRETGLSDGATDFVLASRFMPSTVLKALEDAVESVDLHGHAFEDLASGPPASVRRRLAVPAFRKAASDLGLEIGLVYTCYEEKLSDADWQKAHDFLASLDDGTRWRMPTIHGLFYSSFSKPATEILSVSSEYLYDCLQGYEHDSRVRGAAKAVARGLYKRHGHFWHTSLEGDRDWIVATLKQFAAPVRPEGIR